jgi:1,4-dihydroxy-2-naphthoate octaprenyltransferase
MTDERKTNVLRHIRPLHLMTALALYLAGAGLARYLGTQVDYGILGLGFSWLCCFFGGIFLLGDHFQISFVDPVLPPRKVTSSTGDSRESPVPNLFLYGALALLAAAGVLTILLGLRQAVTPAISVIMVVVLGCSTALIVPGLQIKYSGIGEFLISICLVLIPPALSFITQYGEIHRFLTLSIFPLFPLHLALVLTLGLRSYAKDFRLDRKTLMVRIGWVRGVFLHNMLLLSAFLLFGAAILFGLPVRIVGPVFLALVPAGYLIWIYAGLERGAPVRWPVIIFLALVVFLLPVYLITFTAWIF